VATDYATPATLAAARQALENIQHELPAGQVDALVEIGRAAETIITRATSVGADHVVVGARGGGAGKHWLMGSVSDRVVHHAHCPVTVVR
jgi:nucleotide-binding universal stress UspA family protein